MHYLKDQILTLFSILAKIIISTNNFPGSSELLSGKKIQNTHFIGNYFVLLFFNF